MDQSMEIPFNAIRRLQQQVDQISSQIHSKRMRIENRRINGPFKRLIEQEISDLNAKRDAITRNILQLKKINTETV